MQTAISPGSGHMGGHMGPSSDCTLPGIYKRSEACSLAAELRSWLRYCTGCEARALCCAPHMLGRCTSPGSSRDFSHGLSRYYLTAELLRFPVRCRGPAAALVLDLLIVLHHS